MASGCNVVMSLCFNCDSSHMNDVVKPKRILYFYIHPAVDTTKKTLIYRYEYSAAGETRCQDNDCWREARPHVRTINLLQVKYFLGNFFFFLQKYFL